MELYSSFRFRKFYFWYHKPNFRNYFFKFGVLFKIHVSNN